MDRQFVGERDPADIVPGCRSKMEEVVARVEIIRQVGEAVGRRIARDLGIANHRAATDRIGDAGYDDCVRRIEGGEAHPVGVKGQSLALMPLYVAGLVEGDIAHAGQAQSTRRANA